MGPPLKAAENALRRLAAFGGIDDASMGPPLKAAENLDAAASAGEWLAMLQWGRR